MICPSNADCCTQLKRVNLSTVEMFYILPSPPHHDATATSGRGLLITEASWSHSDTPHLVGLLWTSDQPDTETSTWQHTSLTEDKRPCPRWDLNLQIQQASDCRPMPWTTRPLGLYHPKPHLVGLLWTSDQPDTETSTWQHTSLTEDKHPCPRWDLNLQIQQASDCRPMPWTTRPLGLYHPKH